MVDEAKWRSIDTFCYSRYWCGDTTAVVNGTTIRLPLHAVTYRPHPEKLFIQVAPFSEETPGITAMLVDASGRVYDSTFHHIGTPAETAAAEDYDRDHVLALAKLIEDGSDSVDVAKAILDAGWRLPTADYDDWPEENDDDE